MKPLQFALAIASLFPLTAFTQTLPAAQIAQIDKIFDQWNKPDSPGCALGVYRDGHIVYAHGYGMANLNDGIPITPATVFHVASMSKQFTAASIILLAQQGKLSLDDDIHKYLPELPTFPQPITIRQLMHHTSGLRDQWELLDLAGWRYSLDLITDDDVMSVVTRQRELNFKPGDRFLYSNTGFTMLGLIVKRVSGLSLREYTTENIFKPLGMTHTHFRDDHAEIIPHDAVGYEQEGKDKPFRISITNFDTVGATSLHTTVEDLQLWDENFYHPRVGGPAFIQQMVEQAKLNSGEVIDYASGLQVTTYKGLPVVDHSGGDAGYRSDMTRFPNQHFSAAVLCNSGDTNPPQLVRKVADIVLAKDLKEPPAKPATEPSKSASTPIPPELMTAVAGTYWNRTKDDFEKFLVKDGKLQVDFGSEGVYALRLTDQSHFHPTDVAWGDDLDLHFLPADSVSPRRFVQAFSGGKPDTFEAVAVFDPTPAQLAEYTGSYISEEIDPIYRITLQNGALTLTRLKHKPDTLHPAMKDVFTTDMATLRFTRDSTGHISGLTLNSGRIQNFHFTRKAD